MGLILYVILINDNKITNIKQFQFYNVFFLDKRKEILNNFGESSACTSAMRSSLHRHGLELQ